MRVGLRAVGSAVSQVFTHLTLSFGSNLIAALFSLPIVLAVCGVAYRFHSLSVVPLGIALLVGALPNPACMGLQTLARGLARGESTDFREQWQGLGAHWRVALRAWLIAAAITIICALNMAFYATQASEPASGLHAVAAPLFIVWTLLLLFWLGIHLYVAPLLLVQEEPRALLAYRNAAVILLSRPVASWTAVIIWLGALLLTSAMALAPIIGLALAASIQQNAFRLLLPRALPAQNSAS